MSIITEKEKLLRKHVLKLLEINIMAYQELTIFAKKRQIKYSKKIFDFEKKMIKVFHESSEKAASTFTIAPLGKDLRRNICYLFIARDLKHIMKNTISITKFTERVCGDKNLKIDWVVELSKKIHKRLLMLKKLILTEDSKIVDDIDAKDHSINEFFNQLVTNYLDKFKTEKSISQHDKNKIIGGFIITSKNFEIVGDSIKEIAHLFDFIFTGHFYEHEKNK